MDISTRRVRPFLSIAAVAVLFVSLAAGAKSIGWWPISAAQAEPQAPTHTIERLAEVAPAPRAQEQWYSIEPEPVSPQRAPTTVRVAEVKQQPIQQKPYAEYGHQSRATTERYASCVDCGVVTGITPIAAAAGPSGVGALVGAIAGGVIGHQIGGGNGRRVATVAGALGGAYAGNRYERSRVSGYEMSIRLDSGEVRSLRYADHPGFVVGDAIRLAGSQVVRR
ncbi:glycine zipper 2TM protein [Paraperlucidibaca baekdonensis]|uniref:Glycine zipper 2TM protein n=1 Tax=Paraperlucidibaca baekdonensis TaxID=748120 RepID=A0A3E0H865_9GAMM|nr:glycine zipper 2TM domain-containing protein [Paraperlucidibaca baekdonensis]REH39911.1 glycine zipper 2TM protein [Paraperlucidibaca baekdonensis]